MPSIKDIYDHAMNPHLGGNEGIEFHSDNIVFDPDKLGIDIDVLYDGIRGFDDTAIKRAVNVTISTPHTLDWICKLFAGLISGKAKIDGFYIYEDGKTYRDTNIDFYSVYKTFCDRTVSYEDWTESFFMELSILLGRQIKVGPIEIEL